MTPTKNFFLDMDLTLAKFPKKHGEQGTQKYKTESGFFSKLQPYAKIELLNEVIKGKDNVFSLSNSPTEQADFDKDFWMMKHLPALPVERRIYNRGGLTAELSKSEVAERYLGRKLTKNDILVDDSISNLVDWENAGGTAIFKKNRGENTNWDGKSVSRLSTIASLIAAS